MKALLIYSKNSGKSNFFRYFSYVHKELDPLYEKLDILCPETQRDAYEIETNAYKEYDVLLIAGGDGTFNNAINAVMQNEKRPIIGYINSGTLGDVGKCFGMKRSVKSSIQVIKKQIVKPCDLGKITAQNESKYFCYMAATGSFSDISYKTKKHKKSLGKFSYYWEAVKELFKKTQIEYKIFDNFSKTNFLMVLNGPYVGGFKVYKTARMDDGKLKFFASKGKAFKGLCSYVTEKNVETFESDHFDIELKGDDLTWCIDGEAFLAGNAVITCEKHAIQTYFDR